MLITPMSIKILSTLRLLLLLLPPLGLAAQEGTTDQLLPMQVILELRRVGPGTALVQHLEER